MSESGFGCVELVSRTVSWAWASSSQVSGRAFLLFAFLVCSDAKTLIFNFGDSNSDTGGYAPLMGVSIGYPNGRTFFHRPTGRLCDGRLILDFLSESVNASYLTPYMGRFVAFPMGANFALSGSDTLRRRVPYTLFVQVNQFRQFHKRSIHLRSKGNRNPPGGEDFSKALYTIDIGQNDLTGSYNLFPTNITAVFHKITLVISNIRNAIQSIYELGGRNFWVHNTGPLGCLPDKLGERKPNASEVDEYGCIAIFNELAQELNSELDVMCQQLRFELENSTIVYVDVYSIKYNQLIANSSAYGFVHPLMPCCVYGVCGEGKSFYVSWDGVHYTEAANAIVAHHILSTKYSSPPLNFTSFF
ncbi:hypothetical protein C2S51_014254 [Perilla frutescens var. frutescens]|nr:hypothetical protein C2S51_014254 [Perilla frutescens var. frutescens]